MILCDVCDRGWHLGCLDAEDEAHDDGFDVLEDDWKCDECADDVDGFGASSGGDGSDLDSD